MPPPPDDCGRGREGKGEADGRLRTRGLVSREYRCWFGLAIALHVLLWGYSAYKSAHWRRLRAEGRMYVDGLVQGWFLALPQDLSDPQWKTLRNFFPLLAAAIPFHAGLSRGARRLGASSMPGAHLSFYCASNFGFVVFLHGGKSIWPLAIAAVVYLIGHVFRGSRWNPVLTWTFCLAMVFASDYFRGFQGWSWARTPLGFLDGMGNGVYAWQTQFNLTMLRLVSFNMERYWANSGGKDKQKEHAGEQKSANMEARRGTSTGDGDADRDVPGMVAAQTSTCDHDYTFARLLAYVFYIPLYIAGPIMTYPSWLGNFRQPQTSVSVRQIVGMLCGVVCYVFAIEILLHLYMYVSINNNRTWDLIRGEVMPGWEVAWGGFITLQFMYLKFLSIWRLFRCWALADGVDPPENMRRCVNNNYTFSGFWRSWHASLNRWIVRYLYIPLGGRQSQWWSIWLIFSFIGIWHDIQWRWQAWAWLNCAFFSMELGIGVLVRRPVFDRLWQHACGKYIQAVALSLNLLLLIFANLAIMHGFEGSWDFLRHCWRASEVVPGEG